MAGRIQRALKNQARLFYPRAETIENIQAVLEDDQSLVLYGLCLGEALALVLRPDGQRIEKLGALVDVEAECVALDASDVEAAPGEALARLRTLLVEPLQLGDEVTQVLISPDGRLCYPIPYRCGSAAAGSGRGREGVVPVLRPVSALLTLGSRAKRE